MAPPSPSSPSLEVALDMVEAVSPLSGGTAESPARPSWTSWIMSSSNNYLRVDDGAVDEEGHATTTSGVWLKYVAARSTLLLVALLAMAFVSSLSSRSALQVHGPSLFDNGDAHALLSASGWWWPSYTSSHAAWQPAGCFMTSYSRKHVEQCLTVSGPVGPAINSATSYGAATASHPTSIYLIGDSQTRELFFAFAERFQPDIRTVTGDKWHADLRVSFEVALPAARRTATPSSATIDTVVGVNNSASIAFFWDPYLNRTTLHGLLTSQQARMDRPQMVVVGAGSWFIKNGLVDTFETAVEQFFGKTSAATMANVYVLPLTAVNEERLWEARRSLTNKGVTELNQFLHSSVDAMRQQAGGDTFHYVDALHEMTLQAPALAEDGLHYDTSIYRVASDVLLNAQCNRRLFDGKSPMQATCNTAYAVPNWKQVMTLLMLALLGPVCFVARMSVLSEDSLPILSKWTPSKATAKQLSILFITALYFIAADRTSLFMKQQKHYDFLTFWGLLAATLVGGWWTREHNKDSSFLNRHLTDEWKGWMQIVILVYHYTGASSVSGIYNAVRTLVASYLFMTGFGHFLFFRKKSDFGMMRVAKVLVRLNLLTVVLSYTMNSTYQAYYFSPLVTLWFGVIWLVMRVRPSWNDRDWFVLSKIGIACGLVAVLTSSPEVFAVPVRVVAALTGSTWDAREWHFRVALDRYVVLVGMVFALVTVRLQSGNGTRYGDIVERMRKPSMALAVVGLVGFFAYELNCRDKFAYNEYNHYASVVPVLAYVLLRNATVGLRATTSRLYTYFGRISLETFIAQFHIWLAMDTRGLLVVVPGSWLLNFIVVSVLFVCVSDVASAVTGKLTDWICGKDKATVGWRMLVLSLMFVLFNYLPV